MTEENIKKSKKNLLMPIGIGVIILIISQVIYNFGSRSIYMLGFYGSILGLTFIVFSGLKLYKFNKHIKDNS